MRVTRRFIIKLVYHPLTAFFLLVWTISLLAASVYTYKNEISVRNSGILKVSFLDIGQGDSALIQTPDHHTMMIDGGPPRGGVLSLIGEQIPFYRKHIDVVLATHSDQDHIGGLPSVVDTYTPSLFFESGVHSHTSSDVLLSARVSSSTARRLLARRGMHIILDKENHIAVDILFPDRDVSAWTKRTNDASIVARLTYGTTSFLFTGDSPINIEHYLSTTYSIPHTDVLKVGHHGSRTSTSEEYVSMLSPEYGVISVGAQNRYGHPHKEAIDVLNTNHVNILRTDQAGTIDMESDGKNVYVK